MSGYSEEELLQRFDHQNVFPDDKDKGIELVKEMLEGKRRYLNVEKRYVRKNEEVFWTRLTLSLMHDTSGNPEYFVALIEDIDEEKRQTAALSKSESRFKAMFETSAVGIGILGLDRKLMDANPAMCNILGYTVEELVGRSPASLTYPEEFCAFYQLF